VNDRWIAPACCPKPSCCCGESCRRQTDMKCMVRCKRCEEHVRAGTQARGLEPGGCGANSGVNGVFERDHISKFAFFLIFSTSSRLSGRPSAFSLSSIWKLTICRMSASRSALSSSDNSHTTGPHPLGAPAVVSSRGVTCGRAAAAAAAEEEEEEEATMMRSYGSECSRRGCWRAVR